MSWYFAEIGFQTLGSSGKNLTFNLIFWEEGGGTGHFAQNTPQNPQYPTVEVNKFVPGTLRGTWRNPEQILWGTMSVLFDFSFKM